MSELKPSAADARFVDSVPEIYDRYLGPLFFGQFARDLATRLTASERPVTRVLEIAAGTGILTEELARLLPAEATIVATDLNPPMLAVAQKRLQTHATGARVEWQDADATSLPFPDSAFEAAVCQFGCMFFPDKARAASETYRVLSPGGRWLFNVWDSLEENPIARIADETITSYFSDDPPQFYKVPFSMHEAESTRELVAGAGFSDVTVIPLRFTAEAPSARHAAIGLVRGNPVLAAIEERGTVGADEIIEAIAAALAHELGDRPLRAPMSAYVVSGRKTPQ
jgi:ubiquinone/menaquinone biosynthesis C-methylase UbiE